MKIKAIITSTVLLLALVFTACTTETAKKSNYSDVAKMLTEVKTTQFFTEEKIAEEDIYKVLSAGVNSPSAMNSQPWHFTAVTNEEVSKKLADAMSNMQMKPPTMNGDAHKVSPTQSGTPKMPTPDAVKDAPKAPEGGTGFLKMPNKAGIGDAPLTIVISCKEGSELDAGLAIQNMSAEAQLLGYGTKIMTAPTIALNNDEYKALLSVPEGQKIAAVLIVGKAATEKDNPDAVSGATTRNPFDDVVTIINQ